MSKLLSVLTLVLMPAFAFAQSKVTGATAIWPTWQVSYGVGEADMLFLQNQYRINTDARFNDFAPKGPFSNFERVQLALGYEHAFTDHWRGGALFRYAIENFPETQFYTIFLRHKGDIGGLYFNKQGMFEYATQEEQDAFGRVLFRAELGKRIPLKKRFLTPALTYEIMLRNEFNQRSANPEERTIDRTRLRLSLTYEVTEKLRVSTFLMRQTDYYYVLIPPKYDENDKLLEDGYTTKRNRISPVLGCEIKINFNNRVGPASIAY